MPLALVNLGSFPAPHLWPPMGVSFSKMNFCPQRFQTVWNIKKCSKMLFYKQFTFAHVTGDAEKTMQDKFSCDWLPRHCKPMCVKVTER